MRNAFISIITGAILLSGCSTFQPHQVSIEPLHPAITVQAALPANLQIDVNSKDMRASDIIGYRISRLSDRAPVNLPQPTTAALTQGAKVALVKLGAVPAPQADTHLTIELQNVEYRATQSTLQSVILNATIRVIAEKHGKFLSGSYSTEKEYQYATTPSLADNQKMVNETLLITVNRAFNDAKLIDFLAR
ncbi:YajG family lipoprotein [Amphritea sp. 1_MG-2023]|uniref:YajG family lipoprotein n=1 Tax=Amphritea sp. 1_MG-2023 TaxID=3062670 RepID=UPI0026E357AF|nr:YajG family lipoprotein [Amphritea sp. 1_MG-2023]MDO6565101.1 YajG family lipoprotein [Amphritea sp. 1_MG-2023]